MSFASSSNVGVYIHPRTGNVGIGTGAPNDKLHIGGNMSVGIGGYPYYGTYGTCNVVNPPSSTGTINGVNITVLNKRTRTSYASAVECVKTWTTRTSAADENWRAVCWAPELGIFVAVATSGTGNRVMTSPDGINWTTRTSAANNNWISVCWAPELSLFCAVAYTGTGDRVMTSPDGITWTARTSAADNGWRSVCWAPELSLFVAVAYTGTGNRVMTSPDGITWTARASAADNSWYSVCWAPELRLFVAVGSSGYRVMTSPDGITWTTRTAASASNWQSVCWAPELTLFCAVAYLGTDRVMTSPDGINWTPRTSAANNDWYSVCWAPQLSLFCASAQSGTNDRIMTSPDGITWTSQLSAADNNWQSVCWAPELSIFVAVSWIGTGNRVMTSAIGMPNAKSVVKALPSQVMVDANGNVGIGTTLPTATLTVYGSSRFGTTTNGTTQSTNYGRWQNLMDEISPNQDITQLLNRVQTTAVVPTTNRFLFNTYNSFWNDAIGSSTNGQQLNAYNTFNYIQNARTDNGTGHLYNAYGTYNYIINLASNVPNTIENAYGTYNFIRQARNSTMTNAYGTYNRMRRDLGTMANSFGVYVLTEGTPTNSYGVYCTGEQKNYFSGNVGIGNTNPQYPLEVAGGVAATLTGNYWNINSLGASTTAAFTVSIKANQYIWATVGFVASSDTRIKTNIQDINYKIALNQLRLLQPKTYEYIDKVQRGSDPVIGFIAQEVAEVLPCAVSKQAEIIPSVYAIASVADGVLTLEKEHRFALGDKVKLIKEQGGELITKVKTVINTKTFTIEDTLEETITRIFVYGKEVPDFHTLDKNAIFTIGVAAVQELDRQVQQLKADHATLLQRVLALENAAAS